MIIAINVGQRLIDKLAPQEHREVTEEQAKIYERLLPREIKIIRKDEPKVTLTQDNAETIPDDTTIIDLTQTDILNNEDDII